LGQQKADSRLQQDDLIKAFVIAMNARDPDAVAPFLDPSIEWLTGGLPTLVGQTAALRHWRRLLSRYRATRVSLIRLVADGETRLAEQVHLLDRGDSSPLLIENLVVYRLKDSRIVRLTHHIDLTSVPEDEVAVWRRLRKSQ